MKSRGKVFVLMGLPLAANNDGPGCPVHMSKPVAGVTGLCVLLNNCSAGDCVLGPVVCQTPSPRTSSPHRQCIVG